MTEEQIRSLVDTFATAARKHYESSLQGAWRETNRQARTMSESFREITKIGLEARQALLTLLESEDPAVASMAAAYSLRYDTERSLATLRRIASEPGMVGFAAKQAIMRWEEGDWHLDEGAEEEGSEANPAEGAAGGESRMRPDVAAILSQLPRQVPWEDVAQREFLNDRVMVAEMLYGDVIGMADGYVEWCPNNSPPTREETLIWWWVVRPDLGAAIAFEAPDELRNEIGQYTRAVSIKGNRIVP